MDFIGSDEMIGADILRDERVLFLNLRGDQNEHAGVSEKIWRILKYYGGLVKYTAETKSKIFHILWLNKFVYFDRTFLNIYYKILGKKLIFTAHNVNAGERDNNDGFLNRISLKIMYGIMDHIFVHTAKMKCQLVKEFNVSGDKVTVIPFGINNSIPNSSISRTEARGRLAIRGGEKVMLFFGWIAPYKGMDQLLLALMKVRGKLGDWKLVIAGQIKKGCEKYWERIEKLIENNGLEDRVIKKIGFVANDEVEVYCKGADILILPYRKLFQSGVLFTAFYFGLPVIASDVGSLREDIIEGETGFIARAGDPHDLAEKIDFYFKSDLYRHLEENRKKIRVCANEKHSWDIVGEKTVAVYRGMI